MRADKASLILATERRATPSRSTPVKSWPGTPSSWATPTTSWKRTRECDVTSSLARPRRDTNPRVAVKHVVGSAPDQTIERRASGLASTRVTNHVAALSRTEEGPPCS